MPVRSLKAPVALAVTLIVSSAIVACSDTSGSAQQADTATTSAAPDAGNGVWSFQIGDVQAFALRDGSLDFPNDGKIFAINRTPEDVAGLLSAAGLPSDTLNLGLQPLLVRVADRVLLFDTGAGTNFGSAGGRLPESMAAAGIDAESVTDIFISHVHGDHVGGLLTAEGAAAFPNATIHLSAPEWAFLKGMTAETATNVGIARYDALIAAMEPKVRTFSPDADIIPGIVRAVEIKGHTPGHSGYLITSGESSLLYVGDSMHHYVVSVQRPDWTIAFDGDAPVAEASRNELIARSAESGQRIHAVHFPFPGLGRFERRGEEFVWVPEK